VSKCYWKNGANRLAGHRAAQTFNLFKKQKQKTQYLQSAIKQGMAV